MIGGVLVLVLVYSPFQISFESRTDLTLCIEESGKRLGEHLQVTYWDSMGGSNPVPKVIAAFCAYGAVVEK